MFDVYFLSFKLICDSGYEREINSVAVAAQQVEVFSKVIKSSIKKFLEEGVANQERNLKEIIVIFKAFLSVIFIFIFT